MNRRFQKCFCALAFLLVACLLGAATGEGLTVHFLNAGKADAILLYTERGAVLIDSGRNKMGKEIASRLKADGVSQLDAMIITHYDKDHVGGADKLLEALPVKTVYMPDYDSDSKQYRQFVQALEASNANAVRLQENAEFELDGVRFAIDVANERDYGEDEENDFSLVTRVSFGKTSFLFAGDAENPRLAELLQEGDLRHDVLKVPHHGRMEALSGAFFAAVSPQYAVITSDEDELEDADVVDALTSLGTQVYLTREGEVTCASDGEQIVVSQAEGR